MQISAVPDINASRDELYSGERLSLGKAKEEMEKIVRLAGENTTAERYQIASNILTARLEDAEMYELEKYTIRSLEPLVLYAPLFGELTKMYLSAHGAEVLAQPPLNQNKLKRFISKELDTKIFREMEIEEHRDKYVEYQNTLRLSLESVERVSDAFFKTFGADANILVSEEDIHIAIELFTAENIQKLETAQARLAFLKDDTRVANRAKLKESEIELAKESAFNWMNGVIERLEEDEAIHGVYNSHRWVAAVGVDKFGQGFEAQLCCTRCGMSFGKTPYKTSRSSGELGHFAIVLSDESGNIHGWSKLYSGRRNRGGEVFYHEGMYRLVAVIPYRQEIVQNQEGELFSTQHMFEGGRTGKRGTQSVTLFPVTKDQVLEALQKTDDYFPNYEHVYVLRDTPPLELEQAPHSVLRKLEKRRISEVELRLPLGLTPESAHQLVTDARKVKYDKSHQIDFEELESIGVPKELFGTISRYAQLILDDADPELYKFQGENAWFRKLSADCSSAVLVAILLHPDFRGSAKTLYWLHPTVTAYAGGGATFQSEGVGDYVYDPLDLLCQTHYNDVSGQNVRLDTLVCETAGKIRSTPSHAGLVIGSKGSAVNLFRKRLSFVAGRDIQVEVMPRDRIVTDED